MVTGPIMRRILTKGEFCAGMPFAAHSLRGDPSHLYRRCSSTSWRLEIAAECVDLSLILCYLGLLSIMSQSNFDSTVAIAKALREVLNAMCATHWCARWII